MYPTFLASHYQNQRLLADLHPKWGAVSKSPDREGLPGDKVFESGVNRSYFRTSVELSIGKIIHGDNCGYYELGQSEYYQFTYSAIPRGKWASSRNPRTRNGVLKCLEFNRSRGGPKSPSGISSYFLGLCGLSSSCHREWCFGPDNTAVVGRTDEYLTNPKVKVQRSLLRFSGINCFSSVCTFYCR